MAACEHCNHEMGDCLPPPSHCHYAPTPHPALSLHTDPLYSHTHTHTHPLTEAELSLISSVVRSEMKIAHRGCCMQSVGVCACVCVPIMLLFGKTHSSVYKHCFAAADSLQWSPVIIPVCIQIKGKLVFFSQLAADDIIFCWRLHLFQVSCACVQTFNPSGQFCPGFYLPGPFTHL